MVFLGVQRQPHLLLADLALVDEDLGDLIDAGAGPLAVRDLGISATLPEFELPTRYIVTHLSVLLKRSARDRFSLRVLSPSTLPTIEYGCDQRIRQYAIWTFQVGQVAPFSDR